jgi:hypothetical protein
MGICGLFQMPQREAYLEHDTNSTDQPGGRVTRDPYVVSGLKTMGGRGVAGFLWLGVQIVEAPQAPRIREPKARDAD